MLTVLLIIGGIGIVISGLFIGVWTGGQQQRANFHSETNAHQNYRTKIAIVSGGVGVISFGLAGLVYFL
ncbi:DUF5316 family protein [Priestia koreensis]|uniref:Uncharacterized protein n=1 Tax=Priestia koreensis TaxID=284581 RepID=A0A0M0L0W1_9BACI|nr:DUF5316 family protein [Priestia koreensis]KOO44293.1 hypothetical protein AMD01_13500 [Priestia koreensis]